MLIATIPGVYRYELVQLIFNHPLISDLRLNTGVPSPDNAYETLVKLKSETEKTIWVDLKCRQLRIAQWCTPYYGEIELNHEIEIELPAKIQFRGNDWIEIKTVRGKKIYLKDIPKEAIGQGQSVNIKAKSLKVKGFFTELDLEYIQAAQSLGINHFMLSFYEGENDLKELFSLLKNPEEAIVGLKVESEKGIQSLDSFTPKENIYLVVARDDLLINLGPMKILDFLEQGIKIDDKTIVASQFFQGLEHSERICAADISDIELVHRLGYRNFMFSDEICLRHFEQAISVWEEYKERKEL